MKREWQPGDVALVSSWRGTDQIGMRVRPRLKNDPTPWCVLDDGGDTRGVADDEVTSARPLVVIDPEDREQVERLTRALPVEWNADGVQAALREFANPTPPKPEEPQGLGAVVEDSEGEQWVRYARIALADMHWRSHRANGDHRCAKWSGVDAVRVLSGGVTP